MSAKRVWRLRSFLAVVFVATLLAMVGLVGSLLLLHRIPLLQQQIRDEVARETRELSGRVELVLGSMESRMELLSRALEMSPSMTLANDLIDYTVGDGQAFRAIYLVSNAGIVVAAGMAPEVKNRRDDVLGSDFSGLGLFRAAQFPRQMNWVDKYLSALSGTATVGIANPVGTDFVLLAEVPLSHVLQTMARAAGTRASTIWLVDRNGEILADTRGGRSVGLSNVRNLPIMRAVYADDPLPALFSFEGQAFYPAVEHSRALDWYFLAGAPAGMDNEQIRVTVVLVVAGVISTVLIGLLLAPFGAKWLIASLRKTTERATRVARGETVGSWESGRILELNQLSSDLETMASSLQDREQKFLALFNASPVPMTVADADHGYVLLDVNAAWCREFGHQRAEVLGKTALDIGLWQSPDDRTRLVSSMVDDALSGEAWMLRTDGTPVLCQIFARVARIGESRLMIWATVDITETRRIDTALRELNADLEMRVVRRTQALAEVNAELSGAIEKLRQTQGDLVQAEKMAALGGLVAGVAHELNTPLGNGLMAVTTLADDVRQFRTVMQSGLRRSALEDFIVSVEQATGIASRNLLRAADLVSSFKQVAVDQTSSQRRPFELAEVVQEMVVSMRPSLARTPYQIEVQVAQTGLRMDSYPGPLGQVLGNLINNAVLHGFEGRDQGTIRIIGQRADEGGIVLQVSDDGKGIDAALLPRIFDPFVTTKMGRGGTGLGLHIAYNAVVKLLGGSLTVSSVQGEGTVFELRLPENAPRDAASSGTGTAAAPTPAT